MHVAKEMEMKTGLPSLVILRSYCKRLFPVDRFGETYKPTKFFFVHNQ